MTGTQPGTQHTAAADADQLSHAVPGKRYGSDLVVDLLRAYGIRYVPMNPGASWRGLHDSFVNYGRGNPELVLCTHEKIAALMAHGYAKVTGEPTAAVVHDVVGLMQATMGLYNSYLDQVPVLVLGGTGPLAVGKRRPHFEWVHTAVTQGALVRDFVKWDDQVLDAAGAVEGFRRAVQIATTEPAGPVYLCYDLAFQEEAIPDGIRVAAQPAPPGKQFPADPEALDHIAGVMLSAEQPVIIAGRVGRHSDAVRPLARFAELCGAVVLDQRWRYNMPNTHPLRTTEQDAIAGADAVLALDVTDLHGALTVADSGRGSRPSLTRSGARVMEVRLDLLEGNGWAPKFETAVGVDLSLLANTQSALPALVERAEDWARQASTDDRDRVASRRARLAETLGARRDRHRRAAEEHADDIPVSTARLAAELRDVVAGSDWVLTGSDLGGWVDRLWDIDDWSRFPGRSLGTGTQLGIAAGVALAYRDTAKIVVDIQPDGDLLFDAGALWTIAHHRLPMLVVMFDNRCYYNDVPHQVAVARQRGRDESRARIGMDIDGPAPDYAALARSFDWFALGPVERPDEVRPALERALAVVRKQRRPALVDVVTQAR